MMKNQPHSERGALVTKLENYASFASIILIFFFNGIVSTEEINTNSSKTK